MCRNFKPRLRAASKVRSSSAEPTPWLCQDFSIENASSASFESGWPIGLEFGCAAQDAIDEKAVDDGVHAKGEFGVAAYEVVRDGAGEPVAPAHRIEAEQVVAIVFGLADPELPDQAAMGQNVLHRASRFHGRRFFAKHWQADSNRLSCRHFAPQYVTSVASR